MEGSGRWSQVESDYNLTFFTNTSSLSCQQVQHETGNPLQISTTAKEIFRYFQLAYFLAILPLGVLMNTLVIVLVCKFKQLRTVTFYLSLQVIVVDLLNVIILLPSSTANAIHKRNIFLHFCSILGVTVFFFRAVRTLIMTVLITDRFCSVFMPYWYPRNRVKLSITLSLAAWITSLVLSMIPSFQILDCYSFQHYIWTCTMSAGCRHQRACTVFNTATIVCMRVTNITGIVLYFMMYCKARKIRNKVEDVSSLESAQARIERQRSERHANVTFLLLFVALIGVSFPASLFNQARNLRNVSAAIEEISLESTVQFLSALTQTLHSLLVVIDPVVILRHQDAKEVMLRWSKKLKNYVQNKT